MDQGVAFRCCAYWCWAVPCFWPLYACLNGSQLNRACDCTPMCCWLRKELSTRTVYRLYANRIEVTAPTTRIPWACCGCGSWNVDNTSVYVFDRGAFGFQRVPCCSSSHCCCCWEPFGGVIGRQRCPCNGSPWPRLLSDCGGWWCDEWLCLYLGCHYHYHGFVDPDEVAFASNFALQVDGLFPRNDMHLKICTQAVHSSSPKFSIRLIMKSVSLRKKASKQHWMSITKLLLPSPLRPKSTPACSVLIVVAQSWRAATKLLTLSGTGHTRAQRLQSKQRACIKIMKQTCWRSCADSTKKKHHADALFVAFFAPVSAKLLAAEAFFSAQKTVITAALTKEILQ